MNTLTVVATEVQEKLMKSGVVDTPDDAQGLQQGGIEAHSTARRAPFAWYIQEEAKRYIKTHRLPLHELTSAYGITPDDKDIESCEVPAGL